MNVAICFSGQIRALDKTHESINDFLVNNFKKYQIFAHIPLSSESDKFLKYFRNATVLVEEDPMIKKTKLKNKQFESVKHKFGNLKTAKYAHMQQLYGIYMSNNLKSQYEILNKSKFDWVIRCRSDLMFYNSIVNLQKLDNQYIYTASFHHWGGINDRVVIGSSNNMDTFSNIFKHIQKSKVKGFNAENIFKNYLDEVDISIKTIDSLKFNRVRNNGDELQDFEVSK